MATLLRFIFPSLVSREVTSLYSKTLNRRVDLTHLEALEILFIPRKVHGFQLVHRNPRYEPVEVTSSGVCQHTVISCQQAGCIVDVSIGQFQGTMSPKIFEDISTFKQELSGNVVHLFPCSLADMNRQIEIDSAAWKSKISPDSIPTRFSRRVLESLSRCRDESFCRNCLGVATSVERRQLQRCSACGIASYCGKDCQVLHWRVHKKYCFKKRGTTKEASSSSDRNL